MLLQFRQVLTMLRAKLTLNPNLLYTKILKIIKKYNIRSITGSNSSSIFDSKALTGIDGGHSNSFHCINPGFHTHPEVIVQMSLMQNRLRLSVIRAKNATSRILRSNPLNQPFQVLAGRTVPQHHIHTAGNLILHIFYGSTLMVSHNSRCRISIQSLSRNAGGMTVHRFSRFLGEHKLIQISIRSRYHARKIHEFSDTQNILGINVFSHFLRINHCTGVLKYCSRDTGRKHIPDIQLCILGCINHVLKTDEAAYIHNLMGICDNGGSSMRNQ